MLKSNRWARTALTLSTLALATGCSVAPKALVQDEVRTRVDQDKARMYEGQEPIGTQIRFEEAVARALKYNLDLRVRRMESALALGLNDQARLDMLPQLVANAGYRERSKDSGGISRGILDGELSTRPSTNDERSNTKSSVEFSWNALDFGVSYYRARQQADQYLVAQERRRKVVQNIVQDVRSAYWRALGAQRLDAQANAVLERAELALARSVEAETQKAISPAVALAYQRALLDATLMFQQRRQELDYARKELAALINAPAGAVFSVAEMAEPRLSAAPNAAAVLKLEELALLQRPELREEDLRKRISADEARRQVLSVLPNLSLNLGLQHDSNRLLYSNSWSEGGLNVAWNLMRLVSLPTMQENQKRQQGVDDTRRMSLSMAVLTQVRLGAEQYRMAVEEFRLADRGAQVDQRMANYARDAVSSRMGSELEAIRTQARAVLGAYQRASAYAGAQVAMGKLYNTLGFDPIAEDFDGLPLAQLTERVRVHLQAVERDAFAFSSNLFGQQASVRVDLQGVTDPIQQVRLKALASHALNRQEIEVDDKATSRLVLTYGGKSEASLERVRWTMALQDGAQAQPRPVGQFETTLPTDARPSAREATLQAALNANVPVLRRRLSEAGAAGPAVVQP